MFERQPPPAAAGAETVPYGEPKGGGVRLIAGGVVVVVAGRPLGSKNLRSVTLLAARVLGERRAALSVAFTFSDQNL